MADGRPILDYGTTAGVPKWLPAPVCWALIAIAFLTGPLGVGLLIGGILLVLNVLPGLS